VNPGHRQAKDFVFAAGTASLTAKKPTTAIMKK
jgi:hypothetical protein